MIFLATLRSIPFLLRRPHLLGLAVTPLLINGLLFMTIAFALLTWEPAFISTYLSVGVAWLDQSLQTVAGLVLDLVLLVISAFLCYLLIIPIGAPFYDLMAERIERRLLHNQPHLLGPGQTLLQGIRHSLLEALRRVTFTLPIIAFILILGLVPLIGPLLAATFAFINATLLLPIDAYSYAMDRRFLTFKQKREFLWANRDIYLPFGAGMAVLVFIPCNIIWFPPLAAVAATRMYCARIIELDADQQGGGTTLEKREPAPGA